MLSLQEAAKYCGYSKDRFWVIVRQGSGPKFFQPGKWGRIKFKQTWLDDWLDGTTPDVVPIDKPRQKNKLKAATKICESAFDLSLLKLGTRDKKNSPA